MPLALFYTQIGTVAWDDILMLLHLKYIWDLSVCCDLF